MKTRHVMAAAALVAAFGFLGFRLVDLEQRVAALNRQLGEPAESDPTAEDNHPSEARNNGLGYGQRLSSLEKRIRELEMTRPTPQYVSSIVNDPQAENAVLSVVERENSRIRDVQLEFHRNHWLDQRNLALAVFAKTYALSTTQTVEVQKALTHEVDAMVEQLRRPTFLEDPDQAASDWQTTLEETDSKVKNLLTSEQYLAWDISRTFERQVLWPWLPSRLNKR